MEVPLEAGSATQRATCGEKSVGERNVLQRRSSIQKKNKTVYMSPKAMGHTNQLNLKPDHRIFRGRHLVLRRYQGCPRGCLFFEREFRCCHSWLRKEVR